MSKTRQRGWEGHHGEIPALKGKENLARGNVPTIWYVDGIDDEPWTDEQFIDNARATVGLLSVFERAKELAKMPLDEWPEEDLERVYRALRDGR